MDEMKWRTAAGMLALVLVGSGSAQSMPQQTLIVEQRHDAVIPEAESGKAGRQSNARADFNGSWSVQWCDKTEPGADCGGFYIDLIHKDDRISGGSFGASVRLAQIDEDGVIHGIAVGNTAVLTIESLRSGGIYLVKATADGDCMRWKMQGTIRPAERDLDIIALDDVLTRRIGTGSRGEGTPSPQVDCRGIPIRPND